MTREISVLARESIEPHLDRLEAVVMAVIDVHGGATCDEIEIVTYLSHQCASARLNALMKRGIIEDSGVRRNTRSGRPAIVWRRPLQPDGQLTLL